MCPQTEDGGPREEGGVAGGAKRAADARAPAAPRALAETRYVVATFE